MSVSTAPPRRAVKFAHVGVDLAAAKGVFLPWASALAYRAEERARCAQGLDHEAPAQHCDCGFYAAANIPSLLDLVRPSLTDLARLALLEVELGGVELAGPRGFRAAEQRVLGAALLPWCPLCVRDERDHAARPPLYAISYEHTPARVVHALCDEHAPLVADPISLRLADVAGLLRTEVSWAPPTVEHALRLRLERSWALGERCGPALPERRVRELRMGQVGYVLPEAIRLDAHGRLWVDLRASAPQRSSREAVLAIQRTVQLTYELVATYATRRFDQTLARQRPRLRDAREAPVAHVRGRRYLPQLAEMVGAAA